MSGGIDTGYGDHQGNVLTLVKDCEDGKRGWPGQWLREHCSNMMAMQDLPTDDAAAQTNAHNALQGVPRGRHEAGRVRAVQGGGW